MRQGDDVRQAEQRMVRGNRLALENVEPGAVDAFLPQRFGQRGFVDRRPLEALTNTAVGFIQASSRSPISPRVSGVSGVIRTTKSDVCSSSSIEQYTAPSSASVPGLRLRLWYSTSMPKPKWPRRATASRFPPCR